MKKLSKKEKEDLKNIAQKYTYRVYWSEEDQVYICGTLELPSALCHGSSHEPVLKEAKSLVFSILQDLKKEDELIPNPISLKKFSGQFIIRTTENIHRQLAFEAKEKGISINRLVNSKLATS